MKFVLTIWVCSFFGGNGCMQPIHYPELYNNWFDCSVIAHAKSVELLKSMGTEVVNKYQVGTKYMCRTTGSI